MTKNLTTKNLNNEEVEMVSNCCGAKVSVSTGMEGTMFYLCESCKKPCDVKINKHENASLSKDKENKTKSEELIKEFYSEVRHMRNCQKMYFSTREKEWLIKSKAVEKEIDLMLAQNLFGADGGNG